MKWPYVKSFRQLQNRHFFETLFQKHQPPVTANDVTKRIDCITDQQLILTGYQYQFIDENAAFISILQNSR